MQVSIESNGMYLDPEVRAHIKERISSVLLRFRYMIKRIEVRLCDENGPKGGLDTCCLVRINTDHLPEIVIKDTEIDEYTAVTKAFSRAKHKLTRSLSKWKNTGKKHRFNTEE